MLRTAGTSSSRLSLALILVACSITLIVISVYVTGTILWGGFYSFLLYALNLASSFLAVMHAYEPKNRVASKYKFVLFAAIVPTLFFALFEAFAATVDFEGATGNWLYFLNLFACIVWLGSATAFIVKRNSVG